MSARLKRLKIAGKSHRVKWDQSLGEDAGEVDYNKLVIKISADLGHDEERETLLHEMIHTISHQQGIDMKEDAVRQLSIGLFEAMRNNAGLSEYLFGETQDADRDD